MVRKPGDDRSVSTTELTANNAAERNALTHLAADARMLTHNTHPNLVPVVEARWLAANRLAIIRPKVKGSTLRQTIDAVGPMPEPRVREILGDVGAVLDWAARGNIVHRYVSSDSVCFQKGNGRVMVSFGLPGSLAGGGAPDTSQLFERCADGTTLARLAYEMLTGHQPADASAESLRTVRPDVSEEMTAAVGAGLSCLTGSPALGTQQFLARLSGDGSPGATTPAGTAASVAPMVTRAAIVPPPPRASPLANAPGDVPKPLPRPTERAPARPTVVAAPPSHPAPVRRKGRGLLIASVIALLVVAGSTFALIQRERGQDETRIAANARNADATGDVDVQPAEPLPPDPGGLTTDGNSPQAGYDPGLPSSLPSNLEQPLPGSLPPATQPPPPASEEPRLPPAPVTATPEPAVPVPSAPQDPVPSTPPPPREPAAPVATGCASPAMADQRACLDDLIASSDRELTSVYQALLRSVEERRGADAVERVRATQRAWLGRRDQACRTPAAVDGRMWARERGACMARQSDARALELARELAAVRSQP